MRTITKKKISQKIAHKIGMHPEEVQRVLQSLLQEIMLHLSNGHRFEFRNFGMFEVVEYKQKIGRNPKKPEIPVVIPQRKQVRFRPGIHLKALIESSNKDVNS